MLGQLTFLGNNMILPVTYQLFGPAHTTSSALTAITGSSVFVGLALTSSTQLLRFSEGLPPVRRAFLRVVWSSRNTANYIRLIHCDDGPTNLTTMKILQGNGSMFPANQGIDITSEFNDLITLGVNKNIGFQVGGDGLNQWTLYEVQIEVEYEVPE